MGTATLLDRIDVLLADLDGTLYRGVSAVPGAVEAIHGAAARGLRSVYVTNNASRTPAAVAEHLAGLGFPATPSDVATSAQAAAALLARRLPAGAPVLVVGTDALVVEVESVGLRATREGANVLAVVQGHDPATAWPILAEAALALRAGALWVACNGDPTLPSERGFVPGNGAMVAALRAATGRRPEVAGKPSPALLDQAPNGSTVPARGGRPARHPCGPPAAPRRRSGRPPTARCPARAVRPALVSRRWPGVRGACRPGCCRGPRGPGPRVDDARTRGY